MSDEQRRIAVVTGSSHGLGLEVARQLATSGMRVLITSRDGLIGKAAADKLGSDGLEVANHPLELAREESIKRLIEAVHDDDQLGRVDVLINNACAFPEKNGTEEGHVPTILDGPEQLVRESFEINVFGTLRLTQGLLPLMRPSNQAHIVNVTSRHGRFSGLEGDYPGYRLTQVTMHGITRMLAQQLEGTKFRVNAVDPDYLPERIGNGEPRRSVQEAAADIAWAATLPPDGPNGQMLSGREVVDW